MASGKDELSWLRFICVALLGFIAFIAFAEILTILFFGIAVFDLYLNLPLLSVLLYYQIAIVFIGILSVVAISFRHKKIFYPLFVITVCIAIALADQF